MKLMLKVLKFKLLKSDLGNQKQMGVEKKYQMHKANKKKTNTGVVKPTFQDPCELDSFGLVENNALQPLVTLL